MVFCLRPHKVIDAKSRAWLLHQLLGLMLIGAISLALAISTNIVRRDPLPWVEKRMLLKAGDRFPYVALSTNDITDHRDYLGLPFDKEIVTIVDFQADLLVIEVLNVFCFPCQTQALVLNEVVDLVEKSSELRGRIKFLGVALGNTRAIKDAFVKDYKLVFPVVSDPELRSEKIIGPGIITPFTLFIRRDAAGQLGFVAGTHDKPFKDPKVLLHVMTTLLGNEPGSIKLEEILWDKRGKTF